MSIVFDPSLEDHLCSKQHITLNSIIMLKSILKTGKVSLLDRKAQRTVSGGSANNAKDGTR